MKSIARPSWVSSLTRIISVVLVAVAVAAGTGTPGFAAPAKSPATDPSGSSNRPFWLAPGERSEPAATNSNPRSGLASAGPLTVSLPTVTPEEAFTRAATWLGAVNGGPVPYSMDLCFPGFGSSADGCAPPTYRTDCSGFVSMALGLSSSLVTSQLASSDYTVALSKEQLHPGDLLINPGAGGAGHAVLFEKWADGAHNTYWGYEQAGNGGTHHRVIPYPYDNGYPMSPYHYRGMVNFATRLAFVKTTNTGGTIEVHQAPRPYQTHDSSTSGYSASDRFNGGFSMVGDKLVFIKTRNTSSNTVELHWRTAASGYTSGYDTPTSFHPADAANGVFRMVGSDLVFIKTANTTHGWVEVHKVNSLNNYQNPPYLDAETNISTADATNGTLILYDNDLVFIKRFNTSSGKIEVHVSDGSCDFCQWKLHAATAFGAADGANGTWTYADTVGDDGIPDLVFIKQYNTDSGTIELFAASGATGFQQMDMATATVFGAADASNGVWGMNN
jgi:hypothetical protein